MANKVGRPTKRTKELEEDLLLWVADGRTVRAFCREHKVSSATIYNWVTADRGLSMRLARAREAGEAMIEGEIMSIADTPMDPSDPDRDVAHRKLRIWARNQRLIWSNPGRYGTKHQIGGAVGLPPVQLSDTERATRIQQLLDKAADQGKTKRLHVEEVVDGGQD